jgi:hypothetical protein
MSKSIFTVSIILLSSFCLCNCHKPPSQVEYQLPPITDTGAGTFGCKINGKVWVPYLQCNPYNGPYIEFLCYLRPVYGGSKTALAIAMSTTNSYFSPGGKSTFHIEMERSFNTITGTGNIIDSLNIQLNQSGESAFSYKNYIGRGDSHFDVTKFDTINNIISGTFNMTLYRGFGNNPVVDSVLVTDGRFDFKMYKYYSKDCSE